MNFVMSSSSSFIEKHSPISPSEDDYGSGNSSTGSWDNRYPFVNFNGDYGSGTSSTGSWDD